MKDYADAEGASKSQSVDLYRILLGKLTGTSDKAPRQKTGVNIWRKSYTVEIEKEVTLRAKEHNLDKKKLAPVREKVAKEMFERLNPAERDRFVKQAKEDHEAELKKWKQETTSPPSVLPADRQRCLTVFLLCAVI